MYRIGIDVGGTNTDAVVMRGREILAGVKSATSANVTDGVVASLRRVLGESGVDPSEVAAVMLGTTHFTNAVLERQHLEPTAAVRLGLPASSALPPYTDWPEDIREAIGGRYWMAHGGCEMDGREIAPLDDSELARIADEIRAAGLKAVAVSAVFSPVNDDMERRAGEILSRLLPEAHVTLSVEVGQLGLLQRENAAILNASLRQLGRRTVRAFSEALHSVGLTCPFYITQNDGTLMGSEVVSEFPVLTFASGPTNSMRGASFLTGEENAIVVDVGGTTTDVGSIVKGFPRLAGVSVDVGGVRTNFRMPDVFSIALGGGSIVRMDDNIAIGPKSVGYRLTEKALMFGGDTLTTSDIAAGLGLADFGDPAPARALGQDRLQAVKSIMDEMAQNAIKRMRVSAEPVPVLAVGGGSILIPDRVGDLPVQRPPHYSVANAVGAAIGQISGVVERIYKLDTTTRAEAIADARAEAERQAIAAGAASETLSVLDQEDIPLAYLPGNATRVRVKVVGELEI